MQREYHVPYQHGTTGLIVLTRQGPLRVPPCSEWVKILTHAWWLALHYERALYSEEIFFATSTSRSVTLPPTS